jgi:ribokinase
MNERPRIFVVGSYMHAFVVRSARFPRDGETVFGTDSEIGPGGKGENQAIAAARLGAQIDILACVGDDSFGSEARHLWETEGLETDLVRVVSGVPTGMAFIMVNEQGQNRIVVVPGAHDFLSADDARRAEGRIAAAAAVIAQFESPVGVVRETLRLARKHGVRTVLNPAPARDVDDTLLALVDVITPNEAEAQALVSQSPDQFTPERAAEAILERGARSVVMTLGDAGAYVADASGGRRVAGVQVPVVDTTGAGDAFTGALAVALARGLDLDEAVRFANLGGAFCVTRPGVVPGLGRETDLRGLETAQPSGRTGSS